MGVQDYNSNKENRYTVSGIQSYVFYSNVSLVVALMNTGMTIEPFRA